MPDRDDAPDGGEDFASLLAEYDQKLGLSPRDLKKPRKGPQVGEAVRGRIISIGQEAAFVDLGGKAEGQLDLAELRDADGRLTIAVGDVVEARVVDTGVKTGAIVLRRSLGRGPDGRAELAQAFEHRIPVEGTVMGVNKGGVEVQVAGVRGFCPISQLDLRHVDDAARFVGQKLAFRITRYEEGRGKGANLVLSRRELLEEEARAKAVELRERLEVGAVFTGTVTSVRDYGAFVDLGGLEGMVHVSELGFTRVANPREVLAPGQVIEVMVKKIERSDDPRKPEKISLSLKSLEKDPWEDVAARFPEGQVARGTVTRVESYGAFVELVPGVEGLIHVSELARGRRVNHAREVVKIGEALDVSVQAIDRERRRISLAPAGEGEGDAEALRHVGAGPARLGTFGDLLAKAGQAKGQGAQAKPGQAAKPESGPKKK